MQKSEKSLLALTSYFVVGLVVFHPALRIGFLGDFANDIYLCKTDWFNAFHRIDQFYVPALAIYYGLYKTFHLYPLPYHAFHLTLIFINAWLVYILAQEMKFESWQCWIAGLLALFNSAAFESYFWLTTIPKVLAASFSLIALIFLTRFRQSRILIWGWGYLTIVTIGITIESTALILPLLGLVLDCYFRPWRVLGNDKSIDFSGLRLHFWTFSIAGIFLLIRHLLKIGAYVVNVPIIGKFYTFIRTVADTFFHGLPEHFWFSAGRVPLSLGIFFLLLFVVLVLALHNKQGLDKRRYIILLLLWMVACLPHSIGSNFQSRYLYFPGIFSALLVADLLGTFSRIRIYYRNCTWLLLSIAVVGFLTLDFYAFHQSLNSYMNASRIYYAGIQKIQTYLPEMPSGTRLFLVDFPSFIYRPHQFFQGHQRKYPVWVYCNALPAHLWLLYETKNFNVTFLNLSPPDDDIVAIYGEPCNPEQLRNLLAFPQTVVCRYVSGNPGKFVISSND